MWFEKRFLPKLQPVAVLALLATLVLIFAFQADNLASRFLHVVLIAIPILIQVYFNSGLAYGLMRLLRVPYGVAAPGALIGEQFRAGGGDGDRALRPGSARARDR
jgi:ACR3 family arsenite transporter